MKYYADKQDGKYGVNTDPKRGADTFIPFKNAPISFREMGFSGVGSTGKPYSVIIDTEGNIAVGTAYGTLEGNYFSIHYQSITITKDGTYTVFSGASSITKEYSVNESISLSADAPTVIFAK